MNKTIEEMFEVHFHGSEKRIIAKKDGKFKMVRLFKADDAPSNEDMIKYLENGVDTLEEELVQKFEYNGVNMEDAISIDKDQLMIRLDTMDNGIIAIQQSDNSFKAVLIKEEF